MSAPLEFSDKAYKDRPTGEMLRAYFVYNMFAFESFVNRGNEVRVLFRVMSLIV